MNKLKLDSILLFALVIPFIMTYRIGRGDTPFILFGLIFALLLGNILIDLITMKEKIYLQIKTVVLWLTIAVVIGSAFRAAIIVRHETAPIYMTHDIVLQQEAAIRMLLHGKNPYSETYFGTPLEQWNYSPIEINPALYHFVMGPFYLIFALPFYFLSNTFFGFFDGRIPLLFLFFTMLVFAHKLIKDESKKRLVLVLLAFNPAMLGYTLEGRSDIFMYAFLFVSLYLLHKKYFGLGGIFMGLAFAIKQSVWPILPFYIAFLYFKKRNIVAVAKALLPFVFTFGLFILPFLAWNGKAFLDSTVFYLSGNTTHSYPISGYGIGEVLHQIGIVKDVHDSFPFFILQAIVCIPLMIAGILYLQKRSTTSRLILIYALFLFVFWYLSRYFNNSHLGFLSMVFVTAYFWPQEDNGSS